MKTRAVPEQDKRSSDIGKLFFWWGLDEKGLEKEKKADLLFKKRFLGKKIGRGRDLRSITF